MSHFDYLAIGHITRDISPQGYVAGGTVTFAGRTAQALGCRTAILTSSDPHSEVLNALHGLEVELVPSAGTTTFENIYGPTGRKQVLHQRATVLRAEHLPAGWERPAIVHLAPVAAEVDPDLIDAFSNSLIGLTPQGWMRAWDGEGRVTARAWAEAETFFPRAAAVILSEEDLPDEALLRQFRQWAPLLVLTRGAAGCTVFVAGKRRDIPAPEVVEVNPTGAGDIFAAAFLVRLYQTKGNPWEAARFANQIAAHSVAHPDLLSKVSNMQLIQG
jgi:sugar/nucleoside kinase (ribokinase family)